MRQRETQTDDVSLKAIGRIVDTVQSPIEIQEKTLEPGSGSVVDTVSVQSEVFGGRMRSMDAPTVERREKRRAKNSAVAVALINLNLLLLLLYAIPSPSYGRTARQEQPKEPLGSLTSVGEVYVNDSPAAAELTIFPDDRIRTGENSTATFTMSEKGSLKISPQSQVVFSGSYQFTAELEAGTVALNSIAGPNGVVLRIGNYVVISSVRQLSATSKITRTPDGSFQVSCLDGTVGVLTLEGKSGLFMQASQSVNVSLKTGLTPFAAGVKPAGNLNTGWLLLGLAGAGAAGAAAALGHSGSGQSISPSVP